jgi:hypothetical protein
MVKAGQPVAKKIVPTAPSVSVDEVLDRNDPALPEAAPVQTLLTPEQVNWRCQSHETHRRSTVQKAGLFLADSAR